jgi:Tfp pilus assembly protein PilF
MPEHVEGWVNRGVVALKQKQEQTAIDYFTQALILV